MSFVMKPIAGLFGSVLGGGSQAPAAPPPVVAPAPMPVPDDAAVLADRKRKAAALSARSGRISTILTDGGNGTNASGDKLGD